MKRVLIILFIVFLLGGCTSDPVNKTQVPQEKNQTSDKNLKAEEESAKQTELDLVGEYVSSKFADRESGETIYNITLGTYPSSEDTDGSSRTIVVDEDTFNNAVVGEKYEE